MFGYLSPLPSSLSPSAQALYRVCYCGLCRATECETAKLALSYDSVVLALFRAELSGESLETAEKTCIRHPFVPRAFLKCTPSLRYAASASMLLSAEKAKDDRRDEHGIKRIFASFVSAFGKGWETKSGLPLLEKAVASQLGALSDIENRRESRPDLPADCFGRALGELFAYGTGEEAHFPAFLFGFHLGRWIYLLDAADDLEKDRKSGSYNPFLLSPPNPAALRASLLWEAQQANEILSSLPVRNADARELLTNILTLGMPARAEGILKSHFTKESL